MADHATRVQLCGKLVARIDGSRVDGDLPGRQGRLAFAYLTLNRHRVVTKSALADAIWPVEPPALVDTALSSLISKLRKAIGSDAVVGRSDVRLVHPRRLGRRRGCLRGHSSGGGRSRTWCLGRGVGAGAGRAPHRPEGVPARGECGLGRGRAQRARGHRTARARVHRQVESRARDERARVGRPLGPRSRPARAAPRDRLPNTHARARGGGERCRGARCLRRSTRAAPRGSRGRAERSDPRAVPHAAPVARR